MGKTIHTDLIISLSFLEDQILNYNLSERLAFFKLLKEITEHKIKSIDQKINFIEAVKKNCIS